MKTKITCLLLLALNCLTINAQIPNGGFESWTGPNPNNWITYNSIAPGIVTKNAMAHGGNFAVQLNVVPFFGTTAGGSITYSAAGNQYFPISGAPGALHGWYKLNTVTSSEAFILSSVTTYMGTANAVCAGTVQTNTSVYTEFILNYNYIGALNADSASMMISLTQLNSADSSHIGTFAIIDDLTFGAAVGVTELNNLTHLEPCSPNPATSLANIIYAIDGKSRVNLQLYDILGNHVKTLLEDLDQTTGRYKIPVDVREFPAGIYFYRLNVNGQIFTEKLMVTK